MTVKLLERLRRHRNGTTWWGTLKILLICLQRRLLSSNNEPSSLLAEFAIRHWVHLQYIGVVILIYHRVRLRIANIIFLVESSRFLLVLQLELVKHWFLIWSFFLGKLLWFLPGKDYHIGMAVTFDLLSLLLDLQETLFLRQHQNLLAIQLVLLAHSITRQIMLLLLLELLCDVLLLII